MPKKKKKPAKKKSPLNGLTKADLRVLEKFGVIANVGPGVYAITPAGRILLKGKANL